MPLTTQDLLERSRKELLDLSSRNRLLSIPVTYRSARVIHVRDELSEQVYRLLVPERKTLSFLPGRPSQAKGLLQEEETPDEADAYADDLNLPQPDEAEDESTGMAKRHIDGRLQTSLTPEGLQRRLLDLYRNAATMEEEQGVNVLYLALGHLKWFEAARADTPRYAPLLLIPVALQRRSASEKLVLRWRDEDVEENLSLRAKLKADFGIELPDFPEDEELSPSVYFESVARAVSVMPTWEVIPDGITLGFFSFAKFLMYRDLNPKSWPEARGPLEHPLINGLLQDGFPAGDPLLPEDANLDAHIPASRLDHVVDADSSQTLAIEAVRQGRNLVIQGPPGTGKSQSITNIIATAVVDGKKVLFVAEKLAALQVVKRRLEREGLGDLCLELHSNKSSKRSVIQEIGRTWGLGRPKPTALENLIPELEKQRAVLNEHVGALHTAHVPSGLTPFTIMGVLTFMGDRGQVTGELSFEGAAGWAPEERHDRQRMIEELAGRLHSMGIPNQHPWRGSRRTMVLSVDLDGIRSKITTLSTTLCSLRQTSSEMARLLDQPEPATIEELEEQEIIAGTVANAPNLDRATVCAEAWNAELDGLKDLVKDGRSLATASAAIRDKVTESTWDQDFSDMRGHLAAHGQSWLRFLNGDYRRSVARLRGALTVDMPQDHASRVALVDAIVAGQRAFKAVRAGHALGRSAFGTLWRDEKTDWTAVDAVLRWVVSQTEAGLGSDFRRMFAQLDDPKRVGAILERLSAELTCLKGALQEVTIELALDYSLAFGCEDPGQIGLEALANRCLAWMDHMEGLSVWTNFYAQSKRARDQGLASLVDRLSSGEVTPDRAREVFDRTYYTQLLREVMRSNPDLACFDGRLHQNQVAVFQELDRARLALAKYQTLLAHHEAMPLFNATVGPAGIVRAEMERKRGHRPVRRLLNDAASVVQSIKPVFMMSPLSVAQFLPPGSVEFDLLVIDEASQVQPVDALGAIARCRQAVVVGDSRQLPPTTFFSRLTSDSDETLEDEDAPAAAEAKDMESILGLCGARGLHQSMLRWHYRSRHHSLIAVSNHEFYEDRLFIVPSPHIQADGLGLRFVYLPDGVFDSGASGANRVEAQAIGKAVIEHARKSPHLSLGVAAFSVRQQQAILDELELLRREHPDTEPFFNENPAEPFFVKNLENVQGDERDVIFISVGYGKDARGYMAMRFGPLSNDGGERRLNVLISRAKRQCIVFSSITADDIDLNRASGRGVAALKSFLAFAQTGRLDIARRTGEEEQSPFEEAVRRAVQSLGFQVDAQVGVAGFFIDLAVIDPDCPGRYLLGIECDGAAYHSSRSARERDRLRQAVLEDHGWIIHRIWSTDWFQRPKEQVGKVQEALQKAKAAIAARSDPSLTSVEPVAPRSADSAVERSLSPAEPDDGLLHLAAPYREAVVADLPRHLEISQVPTHTLTEIVLSIVNQEGPIHPAAVLARIRQLWGVGRAGSRIQDSVSAAIRMALTTGHCAEEEGFLLRPGAAAQVRSRGTANSRNLLKPEYLPLTEIREAIRLVLREHHGATAEEIPAAVARVFGFRRMSPQLKATIEDQVAVLQRQGAIEEAGGMLRLREVSG